jgi:hypothetical protein
MDDAYRRLISEMITAIERLAQADAKYGNKLRLENYSMLIGAVQHYASSVPILSHFVDKLQTAKETAVRASRCLAVNSFHSRDKNHTQGISKSMRSHMLQTITSRTRTPFGLCHCLWRQHRDRIIVYCVFYMAQSDMH